MRIGEVEQKTGLPRKTIRFYEAKGLLAVERSENAYRECDESMVIRLKTIGILRRAGISIADLQLWTDGVITTQEILRKRLHELKNNVDTATDQVKLCQNLLAGYDFDTLFGDMCDLSEEETPDNADQITMENGSTFLGIDIGTTTISAVVLDIQSHKTASVYTIPSGANLPEEAPYTKTQDAAGIMNRVQKLIDALLHHCPNIVAVGFTGQMHGIVYMDAAGDLLSPLYTWEDNRAGVIYGGVTASTCAYIREKTGWNIPPGYGLATHIDLLRHNRLPQNVSKIATIMDYAVCRLTGQAEPLCHITNAASFGFCTSDGTFDLVSLTKLGVDPAILPTCTAENRIVGTYRGIPVAVAIGDNQASFLGAVQHSESAALINFGTGSQITMSTESSRNTPFPLTPEIEMRPYLHGQNLLSGSALCGGRAYALLETFFRTYSIACGLPDTEQYERMYTLAADSIASGEHLHVKTTFCGVRSDHTIRGAITQIGEDNLKPGALIAGFLFGMVEELYEMFAAMPNDGIRELVVSGNAVRKNPALRTVLRQVFGMPILIPTHREEAAYGSALFALQTIKPGVTLSDFYTYTTETDRKEMNAQKIST